MRSKNLLKKVTCAFLAGVMVFGMAACSKGNGEQATADGETRRGQTISENDVWYSAESTKLDTSSVIEDTSDLDYSNMDPIGVCGDYYVLLLYAQHKIPDDFDWEHDDYSQYVENKLVCVDLSSLEVSKTIDLNDYMDENTSLDTLSVSGDKITGVLQEFDSKTYEVTSSPVEIDIETGELIKSDYEPDESIQDELSGDLTLERSVHFNGDTIETYYGYGDKAFYKIHVIKADGEEVVLPIETDEEIYDISNILPLGDDKYLFICSGDNLENSYLLDANALEIIIDDSGTYDWANSGDFGNLYVADDGSLYCSKQNGIYSIDISTGEFEKILDYGYCGVSRSLFSYDTRIISVEGDDITLSSSVYASSVYDMTSNSLNYVIKLHKADKNPNAGKTILELYAYGSYAESFIYDMISDYNNADNDYFIEFSSRYNLDEQTESIDWSNINSEDDYQNIQISLEAELSDQLSIDIMNGDGPDIILNASSLGQLNNPEYLVDLSDKITMINDADYFKNIIDASYVGDAIYQVPLSFAVNGIQTAGDPGASGVGYTLDEYTDFVKDYCNGTDPRTAGQAYYFVTLFNTMYDTFIKDGKADFTSEDFRAIAEYCKDNVHDHAASWDEEPSMSPDEMNAQDTSLYSAYSYYQNITSITGGGTGVYGGPSVDGRGPGFTAISSVAISAQAVDVDACWDFVSTLLSEDCQNKIARTGENPINRAAFNTTTEAIIDISNSTEGAYWGMSEYKFDESDAERYADICNSVSYCVTGDAAISAILVEEMPSYFSGQKDLDEVVNIIQDRVQTVLDERG